MPDTDNAVNTQPQTTQTQTDAQTTQADITQTQPAASQSVTVKTGGFVNADGTFTDGWHKKYGEENAAMLSRYKTFDDFVISDVNVRRKFGKPADSLVEIPGESSPEDVKVAFKKATGWSDKKEDYKYEMPKELTEKLNPMEDDRLNAFRDFAQSKLEISPAKFKTLLDYYHGMIASDVERLNSTFEETINKQKDAGVAVLKSEFGNALEERTRRAESVMDKYGSKTVKIKDASGKVVEKTLIQALEEEIPQIKTSPYIRMIFDHIADSISEDTLKGINGRFSTPTTSQVEEKISALRASKAYGDVMHQDHQRTLDELTNLYKQKARK